MKTQFMCSIIYGGVLGGVLVVDDNSITYKTGKVTVADRIRNLKMDIADIESLTWKGIIATITLKSSEKYSFLIFNKKRFIEVYESLTNKQFNRPKFYMQTITGQQTRQFILIKQGSTETDLWGAYRLCRTERKMYFM